MLAPDDRSVLREQLRPDPGYELEYAVCTSFTLDLTAALVAPLAFAAFDVTGRTDPVAVLESVRHASDRIDVFCQAGQIRVPPTPSDLMAFLEPMVHEVTSPIPGFLFHPKVWVLRYRGPGGVSFRLLCGTRNLTDDVSWDAFVRFDGQPFGRRQRPENRPLRDLLRALPGMTVRPPTDDRLDRVDQLADAITTVEWDRPDGVSELVFHTLGLRRRRGRPPLVEALQARRQLLVSPFLDDEAIQAAYDSSAETTIVSRPEALDRLDPATLEEVTCKVLSPLAGLSQPDEDESVPSPQLGMLGGLHAKVYVTEVARQARLFIGSANATAAGMFERNVEFTVEMRGGPKVFGVDRFIGPDADFASLLEDYEPTGGAPIPPEEALGRELDKLLRRLADQELVATVTATNDGWTEHIAGSKVLDHQEGVRLQVELLTGNGTAVVQSGHSLDATFAPIVTADVTPFVVVRARADAGSTTVERAAVVRARLVGDPAGRLDEVIARQVDTPEKFLRFLALLLGLGGGMPLLPAGSGNGSAWSSFGDGRGLFELLIRAVADRPQAISDLDRLVERLRTTDRGRAVLPDGFDDLWTTVRAAHEQMGVLR